MKKFNLFVATMAVGLCYSCSKSPEDVVKSIYSSLENNDYEALAEYVFPDSIGELNEADISTFKSTIGGTLGFDDINYTMQELLSCQIDSTGNSCDFEMRTAIEHGKTYNEKGKLYKTAEGKWLIDLSNIQSEEPDKATNEAIPNINAAVIKTLAFKGIALFQTEYHWLLNEKTYIYEDDSEAFNYAKKAAEQGLPWGMSTLAWDYETGYGTDKNDEKAFEWYLKAAELENNYSIDKVARKYLDGIGVSADPEKAFEWAKKGADKNYSNSMLLLGWMYDNGKGTEEDNDKAMELWKKDAEINNGATSMRNIGDQYYYGDGVKKDYTEALKWFKKSAELGNTYAQNMVGYIYDYGQGVKVDYDIAYSWYRKAAEKGDAEAQYNLGWLYYNGQGVKKNAVTAKEWFGKAAKQGHKDAHRMDLKLFWEVR